MKEATGDLWTYPAQYRCVTTNGIVVGGKLVMGAGVALQAKQKFPDLPAKLGKWVIQYGNRPFICEPEGIITFPTKHDWRNKSCIDLIVESTKKVCAIADKYGIQSIVMTRPGCGNGGLNWPDVKFHIEGYLNYRFVVLG